ncbi:MAG: cell wall anchor protein [Paramuribaculum sp.]|nr:cell wall anchor protein [Paramuribaculum sp.]
MKSFRSIIIFISVFLASSFATSAAQIKATATLDSVAILMGKQTALHIEVVGELSSEGSLGVIDSMWRQVEIIDMGHPEISELGNGRRELRQDITIQSFDSGMYAIPPVLYLQPGETVATNSPVLKVIPVPIDTLKTIHDYADVHEIDRKLFDYLPDWATDYGLWILLAIVVIGLSLFVYFKWLREGKIPLLPKRKPIPPYNLAIQQLTHLKSEKLCEKGEEKQYYTRLTDILRAYLEGRFGINAMEMTSTQILQSLQSNEETRDSHKMMELILETADFVKFAKVRPLPEDNMTVMESAVRFVEETKPADHPETDGEQQGNTKK